jgi:hypothetical protein
MYPGCSFANAAGDGLYSYLPPPYDHVMAYADAIVVSPVYRPPDQDFLDQADASFSVMITTLGAGFFELSFSAGEGNIGGFGLSIGCVTGGAPCSANIFQPVPFTNGQVFTVTAEVHESASESDADRSYVALNDIQVFDPAMNPLGTVTSGRVVVGAVPEPGSLALVLAGVWLLRYRHHLKRLL